MFISRVLSMMALVGLSTEWAPQDPARTEAGVLNAKFGTK
jgi:hypothetical protein